MVSMNNLIYILVFGWSTTASDSFHGVIVPYSRILSIVCSNLWSYHLGHSMTLLLTSFDTRCMSQTVHGKGIWTCTMARIAERAFWLEGEQQFFGCHTGPATLVYVFFGSLEVFVWINWYNQSRSFAVFIVIPRLGVLLLDLCYKRVLVISQLELVSASRSFYVVSNMKLNLAQENISNVSRIIANAKAAQGGIPQGV